MFIRVLLLSITLLIFFNRIIYAENDSSVICTDSFDPPILKLICKIVKHDENNTLTYYSYVNKNIESECSIDAGEKIKILDWDRKYTYKVSDLNGKCIIQTDESCFSVSNELKIFKNRMKECDAIRDDNIRLTKRHQDSLVASIFWDRYKCLFIKSMFISEINSAGGVSVSTTIINASTKTIKYITMNIEFYNRVGDKVVCDITKESNGYLKITGPIYPIDKNERFIIPKGEIYTWDNVIYNNSATCIKFKSIKVTYINDSNTVTFIGKQLDATLDSSISNKCDYVTQEKNQ